MDSEFLTTKEVAELLKSSEAWIKQLVRKKSIPSYKKGKKRLFDKQEIVEWVKSEQSNEVCK